MTVIDQFEKAKKDANAVALRLNSWCKTLVAIRIREVEKRLLDSDMAVADESESRWWSQHAN